MASHQLRLYLEIATRARLAGTGRSSRRRFLLASTTLAAGAALLPEAVWATRRESHLVPWEALTLEAFAAQRQTTFTVWDASGEGVNLVLVETTRLRPGGRDGSGENGETFALRFESEAEQRLPQETYSFEHAQLGRFDLFIAPVGPPERRRVRYEAIINRRAPVAVARGESPTRGTAV